MRTKINQNVYKTETSSGFHEWHRKCKRFLLFPKTIGNERRWWETAEWEEIFQDNPFLGPSEYSNFPFDCWVAVKWLN